MNPSAYLATMSGEEFTTFRNDGGGDEEEFFSKDINESRYFPCYKRKNNACSLRLTVALIVESTCLIICIILLASRPDCFQSPENETDTGTTTVTGPILSKQNVTEKANISGPEPINSLCFPCGEIEGNVTNNDTADAITLNREINMCCMEDVGNLKKLFFVIINEYYRNDDDRDSDEETDTTNQSEEAVGPVAGHGEGDPQSKAHYESTPLQFWTKREAAAHLFLDNTRLKSSNETVLPDIAGGYPEEVVFEIHTSDNNFIISCDVTIYLAVHQESVKRLIPL
ncbi:uncharacterized protein LOC117342975 isoform X2 [Pecten maximus]|uniref:uncharacterized protein LOC117342975 isoform X2 n=1 Tax=Pecten maximus TaxID=6579 RepID=UPI00145827CB|nr:uncharacterized protein LOC117342975 isoform X2 [Pecten maximus]XP_033761175.1 uncharacterized protein LOC117342975 isoform X2 [Pecten maximus]